MKNLFKITLAVALVAVFIAGCKKYEEGPSLSLRSKKARLAGEWTLKAQTYNGTNVPITGTSKMNIKKDGTLSSSYTYNNTTVNYTGKWEFVDSKEKLKVMIDGSNDPDGDTVQIIMLKNKMLKIKDVNGSNTSISTYEQ